MVGDASLKDSALSISVLLEFSARTVRLEFSARTKGVGVPPQNPWPVEPVDNVIILECAR